MDSHWELYIKVTLIWVPFPDGIGRTGLWRWNWWPTSATRPGNFEGEIMIFHVQCHKGPNKQAGYEDVEAESA